MIFVWIVITVQNVSRRNHADELSDRVNPNLLDEIHRQMIQLISVHTAETVCTTYYPSLITSGESSSYAFHTNASESVASSVINNTNSAGYDYKVNLTITGGRSHFLYCSSE